MINCKILLIDSLSDIILIKEAISHHSLPITIHSFSSVADGISAFDIFQPDLIIVGSGLLIHEGFEQFVKIGSAPKVILCEPGGFSRIFKVNSENVCFINRPFDFDEMPSVINKAYDFWLSLKEG